MNLKENRSKHIALVICLIFIFSYSCEFLETMPENKKTKEEFWKTKGDIEAAVIGSYNAVQNCVWKFFVWGEVRGELLKVQNEDGSSLGNLNSHVIDQYNGLCKWNEIYGAINKVNTVIRYAPYAEENDNTFSKEELDEYLGECITLRALLYFYLARTFYEFPYITYSSDNDQQEYAIPATLGSMVLDSIVSDLLKVSNMVKSEFTNDYFDEKKITSDVVKKSYRKGRVTKPFVFALLSDIYLVKGDYQLAVNYCDSIIQNTEYSLTASKSDWLSNFFPGNHKESIFEIQFSRTYYDESDIAEWFIGSLGNAKPLFHHRINKNTNTLKYWEGDDYISPDEKDYRGINASYKGDNRNIVWKWAGKSSVGSNSDYRDKSSNDANWIVYRLAEIYLIKAEAQNRLGQMTDAITTMQEVRSRAKLTDNIEAGSMEELESFILDERARELAFEGKRWFDLVRIAERQADYEVIANRVADAMAYPSDQAKWKARVYNPLSWYLPIHHSELELNVMLNQNPYYEEGK